MTTKPVRSAVQPAKKGTYKPSDSSVKQGFSAPQSMIDWAKQRAEGAHGGNLSLYIQSLIQADMDGRLPGHDDLVSRPICGFLKSVSPELVEKWQKAASWCDSDKMEVIRRELCDAERAVDAALTKKEGADAEEAYDAHSEELCDALHRRVVAQRRLRRVTPLSESDIAKAVAEQLIAYMDDARRQAEADAADGAFNDVHARDPQFALRHPRISVNPHEQRAASERQRPVIIPAGLHARLLNEASRSSGVGLSAGKVPKRG